jgi:aryl-alcohol dehydrogenase-like predicted oxidoreductase
MRTARIGQLEVSVIGIGCNNFGRALDKEGSASLVRAALDLGVTYFDTARNYGNGQSESFLGAALGKHRDEVVIATKFGRIPRMPESGGATRADVRQAIEKSLGELRTDYVDLYQLHFPDPETPIADTLGAMRELVEEGKVREIGCSNFDATQLNEALGVAGAQGWPAFVSDQVQYSMVHRDPEVDGLAEVCEAKGVALLPYYPLTSGLLTGKTRRGQEPKGRLRMERYRRFLTDENFDLAERVEGFARERGLTMVQVALGWLLTRPAVPSVTPGATRPEQVASNVEAGEWRPSPADLAALDSVIDPGSEG